MAYYDITKAAFYGFAFLKKKPALWKTLILPIFLIIAVTNFLFRFLLIKTEVAQALFINQVMEAVKLGNPPQLDSSILDLYTPPLMFFPIWVIQVLILIMLTSACLREFLSEQGVSVKTGIKFGIDESRLIAVSIFYSIMLFICIFIYYILAILIMILLVSKLLVSNPIILIPVILLMALTAFSLILYFCVKFSLWDILTLKYKKMKLFMSFRLTKGCFWSLLASYLIVLLLSVFASLIVSFVIFIISGMFKSLYITDSSVLEAMPQEEMIRYFKTLYLTFPKNLLTILSALLSGLVSSFSLLLVLGVKAYTLEVIEKNTQTLDTAHTANE